MTAPPAGPFSLAGKTALITGASRGIGLAIARMYAQAGANVVLNARKADVLAGAVDELVSAGWNARALAMNAGKVEQAAELIETAAAMFGGLDILVNNAAANPIYGPVELATPDIFTKIMAVNLHAPFGLGEGGRRPHLRARGGGSIINMSSIGGRTPEPGLGIYSNTFFFEECSCSALGSVSLCCSTTATDAFAVVACSCQRLRFRLMVV